MSPTRATRPVLKIGPNDVGPLPINDLLRFPLDRRQLVARVRNALREDGAFDDITTIATVVSNRRARATMVARAAGTISGVPLAIAAFRILDPKATIRVDVNDGGRVQPGTSVMYISAHARALLSAERVALNFMQRLSGIATLTSRYVDAVRGTRARIFDTRKTTPGWRLLEKYAVRAGGGVNHRLGLTDAILIKDNHLAALGGDIPLAVERVRRLAPRARGSRWSATAWNRWRPRSLPAWTWCCSTTCRLRTSSGVWRWRRIAR